MPVPLLRARAGLFVPLLHEFQEKFANTALFIDSHVKTLACANYILSSEDSGRFLLWNLRGLNRNKVGGRKGIFRPYKTARPWRLRP